MSTQKYLKKQIDDFKAIDDLETQKHLLVELLDKNQLYVNLSEIKDADFGVSEADRVLNKAFYGEQKASDIGLI